MGAVWLPARSEVRRRWRSLVVLGLLGALVGAAVVGGVAGARRTSTAYDRLIGATSYWDVEVALADDEAVEAIRALPAVESSWAGDIEVGQVLDRDEVTYLALFSGPALEADQYRPQVVDGRMFDPDSDDEIVVSQQTAAFLGWEVGETIRYGGLSHEQYTAFEQEQVPGVPQGDRVELTVTGLLRDPNDSLPFEFPRILASPGYHREHAAQTGGLTTVAVRLRGGATAVDAFGEDVVALVRPDAIRSIRSHHELRATVDRATEVAARGLLVFAACAALAGVVALGQALNRVLLLRRAELDVYRALGLDHRTQLAVLALPLSIVVVVAALGSAVGAFLGSSLTPVGTGDIVEPHPGLDLNVAALGLGSLGVTLAMALLAVLAAHNVLRRQARAHAPAVPSSLLRAAIAVGAPVPWVIGTRFAVEPGRGRAALPTRSALAGLVIGVAGVVGSLGVVASLDDLYASPDRYGWNHDFTVADVEPEVMAELIADDSFAAVTEVRLGDVELAGEPVEGHFRSARKGSMEDTILEGRMPVGAGEVAVGPELADRLDLAIDRDVTATDREGTEVRLRVVGIVLTMSPGDYAGRAVFDGSALDEVAVSNAFTEAFVVLDPAADRAAVLQALAERKEIATPEHPASLLNLVQTRRLIQMLAVFLGAIALAAMAHVLAVAVTRRRRDLAVLRALGLTGRQLALSVGAMTAVLVVSGLVLGIPAGLLAASVVWRTVTTAMHLPADVTVPVAMIGLLIVGSTAAAAVLSLSPAHRAATLPPTALRTE